MGNVFSINISCDAILTDCQNCMSRKTDYIHELEDNLAALQIELQKLIEARNDLLTRLVVSEKQQMKRTNQVQGWISRVEAIEAEAGKLIRDGSQELQKLCLGGYCSKNFKSSYSFGEKVAKKLQAVTSLTREGAFDVVVEKIPEAAVDERPSEPTIVGLQSVLDKVWRCLGEERVGIIGLYGMGGVGKTTLLTQINNKFLDTPNDFDVAIWVVVSKDLQLEKIQETIGKKIGLFDEWWKNKSLEEKAMDIFKHLSKKKFVILLDDIWERVDLTKVGVPLPNPRITSKIIFTTRFIDVCGLMEAHKHFRVECLPDKGAWLLFQKKVGQDALQSHPDIPELAKIVAKECGGLPLALITIGRAMACKKTPEEWSYAIQVLRRSASKFPGMRKEVYPLLKFSYDSLPGDTIRSCLLYCSLFPEDYKIRKRELIDCWIGEGFLDEHDIRGARNQGYYIIGVLLHACLLEEEEENHVKMHDVIRDMSLWIACEIEKDRENFLVSAGVGLIEAPNVYKWTEVRRISLMENQIQSLLYIPTCPLLVTLFLDKNNLKTITNGFFQFMPSLKILSLSNNRSLTTLPSEISKLVSLEHLDLSWTGIRELPKELKALVNLKYLNLDVTSSLRTIPRHVISNLSMLHELKMFECGYSSEVLIEELNGLRNLDALTVTLRSFKGLQRFLSSHKFQNCAESVLLHCFQDTAINLSLICDMKHLNTLFIMECLYLEELKIHLPSQAPYGFQSLQTVRIDLCSKLRDLTWLAFVPNIKFLHIENCTVMEEIVSEGSLYEVPYVMGNLNPFAKLQFFVLRNLRNLKSICPNALPFPHLKEIHVFVCPKLQKLPLDSNSAKERKIVIKGQEHWWKELRWEDQATKDAFVSCFKTTDW